MAQNDRETVRRRREAENAMREQRLAAERRGRMLKGIGIAVGAVLVIGAIVLLLIFGRTWFGAPEATPTTTLAADASVNVTESDGTEVSVPLRVQDGGSAIQVGQDAAPVTIDYWFDFSCPHCVEYHHATSQTIHDLVASGQAKVNFRPIHIVAQYGEQAAAALSAVVAHEPEKFFDVYDGLYLIPAQDQMNWGPGDYASLMDEFGVTDPATIADITNGTYVPAVQANTQKALTNDGIKGTPTLAVNHQIQSELPGPDQLIALVAANGGDASAIPTSAASPSEAPTGTSAPAQSAAPAESAPADETS